MPRMGLPGSGRHAVTVSGHDRVHGIGRPAHGRPSQHSPHQSRHPGSRSQGLSDPCCAPVMMAVCVDPVRSAGQVNGIESERLDVDRLPGNHPGRRPEPTTDPRRSTGAEPAVTVEQQNRPQLCDGRSAQLLRPRLGLRPWLALDRRALAFFFWVRLDMVRSRYRCRRTDHPVVQATSSSADQVFTTRSRATPTRSAFSQP